MDAGWSGWRFGTRRGFYSGAVVYTATRPHPEVPGRTEEVEAADRDELAAALEVHALLDALRARYGRDWAIGAESATSGRPRWVWAAPREPGRTAPRPMQPAELAAWLDAHGAPRSGAGGGSTGALDGDGRLPHPGPPPSPRPHP
ncbi:hypothetical protein O4J56_09265 [Nocardiopsis sp. RSe5-2]|uniref:Uncharacterized protein n=1 Tax=Nocardiopsis endophytica TaxID=3018445 RepID=A0ABT4U1I9_9ACTN|nr:hypothetical protein [Nocardiopsis endophytica]MDA2810821.1 hypothetical protein [Nocardiopsis endophytica]